jgi:hypothetical protein
MAGNRFIDVTIAQLIKVQFYAKPASKMAITKGTGILVCNQEEEIVIAEILMPFSLKDFVSIIREKLNLLS